MVGSFDYRPYGEVARSWGTVTTGYTYAGLFAQANTSLLLSTTRAYNPANGKWLNRDPIRETAGPNGYSYVNAMPMMGIDPLGLLVEFEGDAPGKGELLKLYDQIGDTDIGRRWRNYLDDPDGPHVIIIAQPDVPGTTQGGGVDFADPNVIRISIDPFKYREIDVRMKDGTICKDAKYTPPIVTMAHELGHVFDGRPNPFPKRGKEYEDYEIGNIQRNENPFRRELGLPERLPKYP